MTYLVDTDFVVDYLKGQRNVPEMLTQLFPEGIALSIITFAEVYEGIYYSKNRTHYEQGLRQFLHGVRLLGITRSIARGLPFFAVSFERNRKEKLLPNHKTSMIFLLPHPLYSTILPS